MKKTITLLTAAAALTAGSFAPASADMNPVAMWEHGKPAITAFANYKDCAFVQTHVLQPIGINKGADLAQVKATFAKPSVQKIFKEHLARLTPKNSEHQGPGYEKMANAYVLLTEALVAQRAATQCGLLKESYTAETAAWVKEANAAGLKVSQEIFAPKKKPGTQKDPKQNQNQNNNQHGNSGSSWFTGFSS